MAISISARAWLAAGALALALPGAAAAQMRQEEPDAMDVARTPLDDFNIDTDEIPPVLVEAAADPYDATGLIGCNHIVAQIAVLDNLLGPDFDIPQEEGGGISAGRVAQSVVGSFIPFRGIVREVSGANKKRRELQTAITAGMVRRGYLKGMGEQRGCAYPARPRDEVGEIDTSIQRGEPETGTEAETEGSR
ncbi:MAG: hypothetical protein V2J14_06415 [Erythrobacter sp.]|jgi:hypothetical protein|nr:hypothetical protein [Erythrobacter sp.]